MRRYLDTTRTHTYSLLFALPLLVLYELGAMAIAERESGMRNGADVLLRTLLAAGGVQGTLAFTAVLALGAAVVVGMERRKKRVPLQGGYLAGMLAESAVYAVLFGGIIAAATQVLLGGALRLAPGDATERVRIARGTRTGLLAEAIGMHESTVCRVTTNKWVQTPWGVYELKAFFPSQITGVEGETSGTAVKAMIRRIVDAESVAAPLCDGDIAAILARKGVRVARRTVAKPAIRARGRSPEAAAACVRAPVASSWRANSLPRSALGGMRPL